nr:hypothetical protein [Tanacetum cinerariifolium]
MKNDDVVGVVITHVKEDKIRKNDIITILTNRHGKVVLGIGGEGVGRKNKKNKLMSGLNEVEKHVLNDDTVSGNTNDMSFIAVKINDIECKMLEGMLALVGDNVILIKTLNVDGQSTAVDPFPCSIYCCGSFSMLVRHVWKPNKENLMLLSNISVATFKQLMLFDYKFVMLGLEYMVNAAIMIMLLMLLEKDVTKFSSQGEVLILLAGWKPLSPLQLDVEEVMSE